jgi:hypothetical protein
MFDQSSVGACCVYFIVFDFEYKDKWNKFNLQVLIHIFFYGTLTLIYLFINIVAMKRILMTLAIFGAILTMASCGSGTSTESTATDSTVVVTDTTSVDTTNVTTTTTDSVK